MNAKNLRKSTEQLWVDLTSKIDEINRRKENMIRGCEEILIETDFAIRKLKELSQNYQFLDWGDEIKFFKKTKPQFVSIYIYNSKILSIESSKPYANPDALKAYYQNERDQLLYFYTEHREFISYYRRQATYLDKKYFVRFKFDFKLKLSPELYSYDEEFSTSHDHLVAQIIANDMLDEYLASKVNSDEILDLSLSKFKNLEWTAPKVALIELLYALHQTQCFNGGQADLAEIFRWAENSLNIQLGNYHKTFAEIRLRKNARTKFLALLQQNLINYVNDLDE